MNTQGHHSHPYIDTLHPVDGEVHTNLPKYGHKYSVTYTGKESGYDYRVALSKPEFLGINEWAYFQKNRF